MNLLLIIISAGLIALRISLWWSEWDDERRRRDFCRRIGISEL